MTTPPVLPDVIEIRNDLSLLKAYEKTDRNDGDPSDDEHSESLA
jgi:hypothetical protein